RRRPEQTACTLPLSPCYVGSLSPTKGRTEGFKQHFQPIEPVARERAMPYIAMLHMVFVSAWLGGLLLSCALCAELAASRATADSLAIRLALVSGTWLAYSRGFDGGWLPVKLVFVVLLTWLHVYAGRLAAQLRDGITHRRWLYWMTGSAPVAVSLPIFYLVLGKPF